MIDFIEAFQQGQSAADIVQKNNQEINSVFAALNEQLNSATSGRIKISREKFSDVDYSPVAWGNKPPIKREYIAICASNPSIQNSPKKELVKWEKGREGYPCKIIADNKQHYCEDKEALENALAQILQDPIIAGTLAEVMQFSKDKVA